MGDSLPSFQVRLSYYAFVRLYFFIFAFVRFWPHVGQVVDTVANFCCKHGCAVLGLSAASIRVAKIVVVEKDGSIMM